MDNKEKVFAKQKIAKKLVAKKKSLSSKDEGIQKMRDLSRLGNSEALARLQAKRKEMKDKKGEEWSKFRRESPSTGRGVGY
jgi:hypothetical protein